MIEDNSQELNATTDYGSLFDLVGDQEIAMAVEDWLDACESWQHKYQNNTLVL